MTKIYGASDDLIEFEGDVRGEVGEFGTYNSAQGGLIVCSDGTVFSIKYSYPKPAIWCITMLAQGTLFDKIDLCFSEEDDPYSDVVVFKDGLKWAYYCKSDQWEPVG